MSNITVNEKSNKPMIQLSAEIEMLLVEAEGELTPAVEQSLAQLARKVDDCVFVLDRLEKVAEFYVERAAKLERIARAAKASRERLKTYVKAVMEASSTDELLGDDFRFKASTSAPRVVVTDEKLVPMKFLEEKVSLVPNKKLILEALEAGEEVPGAQAEQGKTLRVYPRKV